MTCKFCDLNKEEIIRETENTITILSNPYLMEGHSLVIPKLHVEKLSELSNKIRYELIDEVMNVQELLIKNLDVSGCDLRCNYRPFLPDNNLKVSHLHFHVIPRYFGDELYEKSMIHEKQVFTALTPDLTKFLIGRLK
jgi:diadenosine tetraphosphate (Ap4A) HIT family hydrolase